MKLAVILLVLLECFVISGETRYKETWHLGRLEIDYGQPLDNGQFPYHPSREDYHEALLKGAGVSFEVNVVNEKELPVEKATVVGCLEIDDYDLKYNVVKKDTDRFGRVQINGQCGGKVRFYVMKEGWYTSSNWDLLFYSLGNVSLLDGKWQPYGLTHTIVLRPIKKQIPMCRPRGSFARDYFPKPGTPIGLDFMACDWVAPYGKGETADLLLTYSITDGDDEKIEKLEISFPNKGDGLYRKPCFRESLYRTDYNASTDSGDYRPTLEFHRKVKYRLITSGWSKGEKDEIVMSQDLFADDEFLVLRTRTTLDDNGDVSSCHYSKIIGPIQFMGGHLRFQWFMNPTPNDTNLEEDPNHRLDLSDLKEMERQRAEKARREEAVSNAVSGFLAAVKAGRKEEAISFTFDKTQLAKQDITLWLDRNLPLFAKGEMDAEAGPKPFVGEYSAIVLVRYWRPDTPETFDIKPVCVADIEKWQLLPDFENWQNRHNPVTQGMVMDFERLTPLFEEYRRERMNLPKPPPPAVDPDAEEAARRKAEEARRAAEKEAERKAVTDPPEGAAVTKTLSDFLDALKAGRREDALSFWMTADAWQKERIGMWLDKAIPFFKNGEVELVAAGKVFAKDGVAITAIRKWRKTDPELYNIEIACMVRRDGEWRLITNFEDFRDRINKLENGTLKIFDMLNSYYWDYKREHVETVRKRKNARFR